MSFLLLSYTDFRSMLYLICCLFTAHMHLLGHFCRTTAPSDGKCGTDGGNRVKQFQCEQGGVL